MQQQTPSMLSCLGYQSWVKNERIGLAKYWSFQNWVHFEVFKIDLFLAFCHIFRVCFFFNIENIIETVMDLFVC